MSLEGFQNKVVDLIYDTDGTQSGLTDVRFDLYDPAGAHDPLVDFVVGTEIGNTGIYKASFTPTLVGTYVVIVSSALSSPTISNKAARVVVLAHDEAAIAGVGFLSSTDSLEALSNQLSSIAAAQGAPSARGSLI